MHFSFLPAALLLLVSSGLANTEMNTLTTTTKKSHKSKTTSTIETSSEISTMSPLSRISMPPTGKPTSAPKVTFPTGPGGVAPNGLPKLSEDSVPAMEAVYFNAMLKSAYYNEYLGNLTKNVPGFQYDVRNNMAVIKATMTRIAAQERLHLDLASTVLKDHDGSMPSCKYNFDVSDVETGLVIAQALTVNTLGMLQDAIQTLAKNKDYEYVRIVASMMGVNGEQNSFYLDQMNSVAAQKPFSTVTTIPFTYSLLQQLIVSCTPKIKVATYPNLKLTSGASNTISSLIINNNDPKGKPKDTPITFTANLKGVTAASAFKTTAALKKLYITYLTGQQTPVSMGVTDGKWAGDVITVNSTFPYSTYKMDGVSFAALTTTKGFKTADDLTKKGMTLAAPALIQVLM